MKTIIVFCGLLSVAVTAFGQAALELGSQKAFRAEGGNQRGPGALLFGTRAAHAAERGSGKDQPEIPIYELTKAEVAAAIKENAKQIAFLRKRQHREPVDAMIVKSLQSENAYFSRWLRTAKKGAKLVMHGD